MRRWTSINFSSAWTRFTHKHTARHKLSVFSPVRWMGTHTVTHTAATLTRLSASCSVSSSCAALPHPDHKGEGEDAYLCLSTPLSSSSSSSCPSRSAALLGVFDGVGSWSFEQNVDVSRFSRELCAATEQAAQHHHHRLPDPSHLLAAAWQNMKKKQIVGSSTACLLSITADDEKRAQLQAVSVGDSGFMVLRRTGDGDVNGEECEVVESTKHKHHLSPITTPLPSSSPFSSSLFAVLYRSLQQLHYFNCPYQLGVTLNLQTDQFDDVCDGVSMRLSLIPHDVLIVASDGLFDNVDESELIRLVDASSSVDVNGCVNVDVCALSLSLVNTAFAHSLDRSVDGPFALLAKDNNIMWSGGRKDDISVIVSQLLDNAVEQVHESQIEMQQPQEQTAREKVQHQQAL